MEKLRYIHRNPVREELCLRPEDWVEQFSPLRNWLRGVVQIESDWTARKREGGGRRPCPAVELTELTSRPTQLSAQAKPGLSGQGEISGEPHSSQKAGLNGPPAVKRCYRGRQEATRLNP